jgi:hypothetical protein
MASSNYSSLELSMAVGARFAEPFCMRSEHHSSARAPPTEDPRAEWPAMTQRRPYSSLPQATRLCSRPWQRIEMLIGAPWSAKTVIRLRERLA